MKTFEETRALLDTCVRSECRDHAFGDREIFWEDAGGNLVAEGYAGASGASVWSCSGNEFENMTDDESRALLRCGRQGQLSRNDSTGPDSYDDGECMPGLTVEGVRRELVGE